jgi:hypothetical protein
MAGMANWEKVAAAEPEFTDRVRALFDAHKHKVLATLRADGSPRVSGSEMAFTSRDACIGSMLGARKAQDLLRDPRFALHAGPPDPPDDPAAWSGDAKLAGRAVEVTDPAEISEYVASAGSPPGPFHLFRLDVSEVVLTKVGDPADHLVIEFWREEAGLQRVERR